MKKLISLLLTVIICVSITACGGSTPDKQPAIDAFNNATTAYDALVDKINPNIDDYEQELIDIMIEMGDALTEHKNILESDQTYTEEEIKELVGIFGEVEAWAKNTDSILDSYIEETADKSSVIDLFNKVSEDFNAMAAKINANIASYDQEVIDVMTQMANALNECKTLLESDTELSAEMAEQLMSNLSDIEGWVKEADEVLVIENSGAVDKQTAIAAFNSASEKFNAIATEINSHIEDFPEELIDGMTQMAEGLSAYQVVLSSDYELNQEQLDELMEICGIVEQWAAETEEYVFG